ncbi:signal peptidase I [Williamsia muralis]|jgi:signal peptidase|uniref:signal peptidase I n=1 Tax=Williamsia marianensis TaxID=85044 RepID=UPI000DE75FE5|nr:signal peptidase I [Williamsia marianensis]PVY30494.1 signal peptidase [Williamsia marianensis]
MITEHASTSALPASSGRGHRTGPLWWTLQIITWLILMILVAILLAAIVVPKIAGAQPYTVLTSSMKPGYPPGTLIVVQKVDTTELAIGDVVTYQMESDKSDVITHRVVGFTFDQQGNQLLTTQGDAVAVPDANPVVSEQVRGKLWYAIPYLGYVNNWVSGSTRLILVYVLASVLVLYAATQFVGSVRERRASRSPT